MESVKCTPARKMLARLKRRVEEHLGEEQPDMKMMDRKVDDEEEKRKILQKEVREIVRDIFSEAWGDFMEGWQEDGDIDVPDHVEFYNRQISPEAAQILRDNGYRVVSTTSVDDFPITCTRIEF